METTKLIITDTSNVEYKWAIIEPDGTQTDYDGFYAACEMLLSMPGISQLLEEAMHADGIYGGKENQIWDWMADNAESFVADHGYSLQQVRVK